MSGRRCPFCSGCLEAGTFLIHTRSLFTRLRAQFTPGGFPSTDLFFTPAGSDESRRVVEHGEDRRGHHCGDCGAMILSPTHPAGERRTCSACGESMPATHTECWSCGSTVGGVAPPESLS